MLSLHPSFSHRFGAIVTGIGAQGWSGNVMTHEYGAAIYLGTVVTDAFLQSDPVLPPRHFTETRCMKCKLCERCCATGMFLADDEEWDEIGEILEKARQTTRNSLYQLDLENT